MSEAYLDCAVEIQPVDAVDRRSSQRFASDGITTSVRQAGFYKKGAMTCVRVLDIGSGGLSFESSQRMSPGQKVELKIDTPVRDGLKAMARVKYCIRWASNYRIGLEFVEISHADQKILTREFFESPD